MLGSRIITSGEECRMCCRLCLASLIGASGLRMPREWRSSSPRKGVLGTLRSHEELERFAMTISSEVHPRASLGLSTETFPEKFGPPGTADDCSASEASSSTQSDPRVGTPCPDLRCISLRTSRSLTSAWTAAAGESPCPR